MNRIIALNENIPHSEDGTVNILLDDEQICCKFVCETHRTCKNGNLEKIVNAEYIRALTLIYNGREECALSLLNGLLETKVLNEVASVKLNSKLLCILHNCYKNAAYIYKKKKDFQNALKYSIYAIQFDEKDVHAMVHLGQLALKKSYYEMAEFVFNNCLKQNINHWKAVDGILRILVQHQNILGVYGWCLKILSKDPSYKLATNVISEVNNLFSDDTFFFKDLCLEYPIYNYNIKLHENTFKSLQWKTIKNENSEKKVLQIPFLNWLSIECILNKKKFYEFADNNTFFMLENKYYISDEDNLEEKYFNNQEKFYYSNFEFTENNEVRNKSINIEEKISVFEENNPKTHLDGNKNQQQNFQLEKSIELPLNNLKSEGNNNCKSKCKRRCSDLHFLEQWSWHKNRRYSSRKKIQVRSKTEATLKEYLDRIFRSYLRTTFPKIWPLNFKDDLKTNEIERSIHSVCCRGVKSLKDFFIDSQKEFNLFKKILNGINIDIILLTFTWLKYISEFWNTLIPKEVLATYYKTCSFYMNYIDITSWSQYKEDFTALYKIFLLFLEIEFQIKEHENSEISDRWKSTYNCLMCYAGIDIIVVDTNFESNMLRLLNLGYKLAKYENNLMKCESLLIQMESLLDFACSSANSTFHLPNMEHSCLNKQIISIHKSEIKRKLSLIAISDLYKAKKWAEIVEFLSKNLMHVALNTDCRYWKQDLKTQFHIIIEALWNLNDYESCLKWSENLFHLSVTTFFNEMENIDQYFWIQSINFAVAYIECVVIFRGCSILNCLQSFISRLVQNIIKILSAIFDTPLETQEALFDIDIKKTWIILHQISLRDEQISASLEKKDPDPVIDIAEMENILPNSNLILFTAHDFLGKRKWCTRENGEFLRYILDVLAPTYRAPSNDAYRDVAYEYLEQVTYCLYGFPSKKTRLRHLEDHESEPIELNLKAAIQLFDIYRPESLPEFNSYKLESISSDMEQLLLKAVNFLLAEINTEPATSKIMEYINCASEEVLEELATIQLSYKISPIFYLLADYYFKNRDFSKTLKYYTLDLAHNPFNLDSWAGMALSKASKIESQLNDFVPIEITTFLSECESIIRCFEQCRLLNPTHTLLWIEYGSFSYTIYSFCSRHLKQHSPMMSIAEFTGIEKQKEKMLNIAFNCFTSANSLQNKSMTQEKFFEETQDEKWLCRYMLGKITEKRKEEPKVYLNHYLKAAHYLYENNATYPIKINHSSPTPLSVEALEIFYRTNSAILKYLETQAEIDNQTGDLFMNVLKNLSSSPFAFNKAKIDGNTLNAFKRSMKNKECEKKSLKKPKFDEKNVETVTECWKEIYKETKETDRIEGDFQAYTLNEIATSCVPLLQLTNSSSSDSFTDSDTDAKSEKLKNDFYSKEELTFVYSELVNNLEECITRFPEHFKSIYRLAFHFMNAPHSLQDLDRCENLLLGQYTTRLGNQINGIFADRRSNNIFNGIWRLPSSEIDRPGSFSTHMVKCVSILIQLLVKRNNYKLLIEIGLQLYKTPENDKRYIKDAERIELYQQSMFFCVQIVREILKKNTIICNNDEILNVLIDIYKAHKKCIKCMNEKESPFTHLLVEIYKFYTSEGSDIPENSYNLDIVIKFCIQEINSQKTPLKNNDDSKLNKAQSISIDSNKFSSFQENCIPRKEKFDELLLDHAELNSGRHIFLEKYNTNTDDNPPSVSRNSNNEINSTPKVNASSAVSSNDIGYPHLTECYKVLEVKNKENDSLKNNASKADLYFSMYSDFNFKYNSLLKLNDSEMPQAKITFANIPQTVFSNNNTEKEISTHHKISKSYELNGELHKEQTILKTVSKPSNIIKINHTTNAKHSTILNPQEQNRTLENKQKCKSKIFSTKISMNSKPYKKDMVRNEENSTLSMKTRTSLPNYAPTEYVTNFESRETHFKCISSRFENFTRDEILQQSFATYNLSKSPKSNGASLLQSITNTGTENSHNTSATNTSLLKKGYFKANEDALKLNTGSSLQQITGSCQLNSDSNITVENIASLADANAAGSIIILD